MKKLILLTSCMMMLAGCSQKTEMTSGIHPENFDTTVRPQDDFYEYACGSWIKNNPLKPEYSRYGTFDQLRELNQERLQTLIEDLGKQKHKKGSVGDKIGTLYTLGMDDSKLNADGFSPVYPELQEIAKISNYQDFQQHLALMHKNAVHPFFGTFAEADVTNSTMDIAWIYQSGLGMGDRDYYLENDERSTEIREQYKVFINKMMTRSEAAKHIGVDMTPEQLTSAVMRVEMAVANAFMDKLSLRDPFKTFNKKTLAELEQLTPAFDFTTYFQTLGVEIESLNVGQPDYLRTITNFMSKASIDDLKAYLAWNVINEAAAYLDDQTQLDNFTFYGQTMSGAEEMQPRWKRVVSAVNGTLGEAVGQLYVERYFPPQAKERMINLVANLQIALGERIDQLEWMSPETKVNAHEKLNTFHVKIGYPDKWKDYSSLDINNDSYYANIVRARKFGMDYELNKINKPKDKDEWGMTPQTVNAYYNPTTNEICFPAAILQPPFFDLDADDAVNYGAIGVVIGHEMTHGFDDKGRFYDKDGNLNNWWTDADGEQFDARTKILVDHFDKIEVAPGVHANGSYTLGENIADNGGVQISWVAMQKAIADGKVQPEMDGFSAAQRFFIAYATVWASNIRDQEIIRLTKVDVHSLGRWRVNATLPHIQQFQDAFGVQKGDGMYLAPEEQAIIW